MGELLVADTIDPHHLPPHTSGEWGPEHILGFNIRIYRGKRHDSPEAVVETVNNIARERNLGIDLSVKRFFRFEKGYGNPDSPLVPLIAEALDCSLHDLLKRGDD